MTTTEGLTNLSKRLFIPNWLFFVLLTVLVLRIPSLFEPYSYGDEMIYLTLGEGIRQGIPLYSGIHDNKPPLLYLIAAISGNLFWFRAILSFWSLLTIYFFWKLSLHLFPKKKLLQKISTLIFALLTTLPLLEGNIANAENFMIAFSILAFLTLLKNHKSSTNIVIGGTLFSIATLFKIPAAFEVPAIIFYWISTEKLTLKSIFKTVKKTALLSIGLATPIAATFVWFWYSGSFPEYFAAAFGNNVGYLSSFRPEDTRDPLLIRNAPLIIRGIITLGGLSLVFVFRKKLSKQFIFLTAWLLLTTFAVALSERPYPHYILQSVPALSLLLGMLITVKTLEQSLVILPIATFLIVPVYYNFWHYPSMPYYSRFVKFVTRKTPNEAYKSSFGDNVIKNYKISSYLTKTSNPTDKIFVWGDNGTIYALSRRLPPTRYVVDYHIKDFSTQDQTIKTLQKNTPKFIVILPNADPFPKLDTFLKRNYGILETIDGAKIWKLLSFNSS